MLQAPPLQRHRSCAQRWGGSRGWGADACWPLPQEHPTFPAPAAPSWAAGCPPRALAQGRCRPRAAPASLTAGEVSGGPPQHPGNRESPGSGHTAHPRGFRRTLPRTRGCGMVLQSRCPLACMAFGSNSHSPGTVAKPVCLSPHTAGQCWQAGAVQVPHPSRLWHGCSQRDRACHKERVKSKPHSSCLLSLI